MVTIQFVCREGIFHLIGKSLNSHGMKITGLLHSDLFMGQSIFVFAFRNCWPICSIPAQPAAGRLGRCFVVLQLIFMIVFCCFVENPMRGICSYLFVANCSYIPPGGSA